MNRTTLGVAIGAVLGFAVAFGSVGQMLILALFIVIGVVVAKVIDGDIDLGRYVSTDRRTNSR